MGLLPSLVATKILKEELRCCTRRTTSVRRMEKAPPRHSGQAPPPRRYFIKRRGCMHVYRMYVCKYVLSQQHEREKNNMHMCIQQYVLLCCTAVL